MYLQDPESPYNILWDEQGAFGEYRIDAGEVDGCVADLILQYALFGEVVFG